MNIRAMSELLLIDVESTTPPLYLCSRSLDYALIMLFPH